MMIIEGTKSTHHGAYVAPHRDEDLFSNKKLSSSGGGCCCDGPGGQG